ncbi:MAG: GNAT family N-acetyltransferase [Acidobacteriales bacterium]|nr:GNAT family N-acetyltransferase [Terriglobales bacterium]
MRIECGPCVLRPWEAGEAVAIVRLADDWNVARYLRDRFPHPYTLADAEKFLAKALSGEEREVRFAIETAGGELAGGIGLIPGTDIERLNAEIGYWLGEPYWGRGLAPAAVRAMTEYGFDKMGLARIFAVTMVENTASMRVLEKCGYVAEGRMRRSAIKRGVVHDQMLYARVR